MIANKMSSKHRLFLGLLTYGVALHGLLMIAATLAGQLEIHLSRHGLHLSGFVFDVPILLGLSLLYLSVLLRRRKRTAWSVTLVVYGVILILSLVQLAPLFEVHYYVLDTVRVALPVLVIFGLWYFRRDFTVRSDLRSFAFSLRFIALVLAVAFAYGVIGFSVMDQRDFHQEISIPEAAHHTIDQFGLTTSHDVQPQTRRAKLFVDSLSVVSIGALVYAALSLFQPIRARLVDESSQRALAAELLEHYHGSSEDFFKLWPHDKLFFFNLTHTAGVAYGVRRGVALVVGDPFGKPEDYQALLRGFTEYCRTNDWAPAFIHTEPKYNDLYKEYDLDLQKMGEEAVLDLHHFATEVKNQKYFRQINNKFTKQGYTTELLQPPHNDAVLSRLSAISKDFLSLPGRSEHGFMQGHYTSGYMQQCPIMVMRDAAGTIQAFINQVHSYDPEEANFDLLRHTHESPGNANDFLLMQFIEHVHKEGFKRLNLGLCPLSGIDGSDEERTLIDNALRFMYTNGDRIFSFSGLRRFKAKYQPVWTSRYVAFRGGIPGLTRVINALNRALKP